MIIFLVTYLPVAISIGFLDFRRGTYKAEQELSKELSPIWREVFQAFKELKGENLRLEEKFERLTVELKVK